MRALTPVIWLICLLVLLCQCDAKDKTAKKLAKAAATMAGRKTGRFFTAWTIISLVMLLILLAVGGYYFFICFPIVCAKRGKYDVMEMANV
ncbi:Hypothetical protein NTJ_04524 [Nesidiocoris tenuis]|uniref:Uncharacterized protein n=1 Tax=Nesidiocoris tenuis TaxID=355587 RepID=A0ABN7AMY1_9HEMI|nr:Hypothetical protein NTJ_04524 [Nesidiocoris tenuis]